jgi:hypothetical protein
MVAAEGLVETDEKIDELQSKRHRLAATCSNPCVLTKTVDGQVFTVTVCTSPEAYTDSNNLHVATHVERAFEL